MSRRPILFPVVFRCAIAPYGLRGKNFDSLRMDAEGEFERLLEDVQGIPRFQRFTPLRRAELARPADIAAHLTACNLAYAEAVSRLGKGAEPVDFLRYGPFDGAHAQDWERIAAEHEDSFRRLVDALVRAPDRPATSRHPWVGNLDQREWTLLLALHYRYHRRQLRTMAARAGALESSGKRFE